MSSIELDEPARRVEQDHDGVVVLRVRALELLLDEVARDRVDVVLELDRQDAVAVRRGALAEPSVAPATRSRRKAPHRALFTRKDSIREGSSDSTPKGAVCRLWDLAP